MPDSTKNLLKRTDGQLRASHERCIAACNSISQSTETIALTRELIIRSRRQIALLWRRQAAEEHTPLLGPRK
jgi:hypothetical protein